MLLAPNDSGRFESRFVALAVEQSPAVMLQGMAGSTLGIWVAHGEGNSSGGLLAPSRIHSPAPHPRCGCISALGEGTLYNQPLRPTPEEWLGGPSLIWWEGSLPWPPPHPLPSGVCLRRAMVLCVLLSRCPCA